MTFRAGLDLRRNERVYGKVREIAELLGRGHKLERNGRSWILSKAPRNSSWLDWSVKEVDADALMAGVRRNWAHIEFPQVYDAWLNSWRNK